MPRPDEEARAARLRAANINPRTGLATDYLNHSQQAVSPTNPYGFHGQHRRIDTPEGAKLFCDAVIPPLKDAWNLPQFAHPNEFYSNQPIGQMYAALAPDVPEVFSSPITKTTQGKIDEAYTRAGLYYDQHGEEGLEQKIKQELDRAEEYLQIRLKRHAVIASVE